ncbi:MFS transporter [Paenibacillus pasadenensis]|uniref:MFS transporter n=1 Tax=Paenibacillus pasadenensis TaxID=217090 RepID=UPI00203C2950|nr:MFS transporter [Paenibacillus pasadenensis]MCM3748729.1 MFS transporter [Paenibacillus pasadenensis]
MKNKQEPGSISSDDKPKEGGEKLIWLLSFTMMLASMSAIMFNIVLPQMESEYGLSLSEVSWMTTGYMLIYAIGSAVYGKLADLFRLKNLLTFGLALFLLGSLIGLVSSSYGMVLTGRLVQATGAAVIPASAMIIPIRYFPPAVRGRALGLAASALALGNALGPVVAALIVSTVHWRWLFCAPLIIVAVLPFYRRYLNDEPAKGGTLDLPGGLLIAGATALLLLGLTQWSWLFALAGVALIPLLVWRLRTAKDPFIRPELFRNRIYCYGLVLSMIAMAAGYSIPFLTPQLLASVHELQPGVIGFAMVPAALVAAAFGRSAGRLADRRGNGVVFYMAASLLLVCFALMALLAGVSPWLAAGLLIIGQLGQMLLQISLMNSISLTLPKEQAGAGMGLMSLLNFLSGAAAGAIYSRILDSFGNGAEAEAGVQNVFMYIYAGLFVSILIILAVFRYRFNVNRGMENAPAAPAAVVTVKATDSAN